MKQPCQACLILRLILAIFAPLSIAAWIVLALVYELAVSGWNFAGFGVSLAVAIWVVASYLGGRRVSLAESVSNDGARR